MWELDSGVMEWGGMGGQEAGTSQHEVARTRAGGGAAGCWRVHPSKRA